MNSEATDIEVRLLLEAIHSKYGYDLRGYNMTSIRRRILATLAKSGLSHMGELQHRLLHDAPFFDATLEDLTVRVTEMFRDPTFYRMFRERVVPQLRTYPLLKIWHCGCATGQEAYASAILLTEEGLYDRCQIYATDMSLRALETAKEGVYPAEQLANFTENHAKSGGTMNFASFYTAAYGRVAIKESLRRNILFFHHNLVSDHVFGEMHVIFCRNVLIYFGPDLRTRVMLKFSESLIPSGFLCLGSSEQLRRSNAEEGHFVEFAPAQRIYRSGVA